MCVFVGGREEEEGVSKKVNSFSILLNVGWYIYMSHFIVVFLVWFKMLLVLVLTVPQCVTA